MADIEKGLPNTKIPLPGGAEEVDVNVEEIQNKGPIAVSYTHLTLPTKA